MTSPRPELGTLTPGMTVYVRRSANDMRWRPASERYIEARVVKAARVWIDLASANDTWSTWRMRRDTQDEGTGYTGSQKSFVTPEQRRWDERLRAAREVLDEQGITIGMGSPWRGREIELANLLNSHAR